MIHYYWFLYSGHSFGQDIFLKVKRIHAHSHKCTYDTFLLDRSFPGKVLCSQGLQFPSESNTPISCSHLRAIVLNSVSHRSIPTPYPTTLQRLPSSRHHEVKDSVLHNLMVHFKTYQRSVNSFKQWFIIFPSQKQNPNPLSILPFIAFLLSVL